MHCLKHRLLVGLLLLGSAAAAAQEPAEVTARRAAERDRLIRLLPKSPAWEAWLTRTGELPPDYESLPASPGVPDPLAPLAADARRGPPITNAADWPARQAQIRKLITHYITGTVPAPPEVVTGKVLERETSPLGTVAERVELRFGPPGSPDAARLRAEIFVPVGRGPFPVFVTQHNHRAWAVIAVSRGYIACVYNGADTADDTAEWVAIWPDHDWTKLTRRAWAASRCVDWLLTRPDVDRQKIAVTGHSRNGKTSLIAGALDERFTCVISSSSGTGGACPYRFVDEARFLEGIGLITQSFPDWLHPRLRFFVGREDRLPTDQHELVAAIAPRACLISVAENDWVESTFAVQQTVESAGRAWQLLGVPERLRLAWRPAHHETAAEDIQVYMDWCDHVFGRAVRPLAAAFPETWVYPRFADWQAATADLGPPPSWPRLTVTDLVQTPAKAVDWAEQMRLRVRWSLGDAPPRLGAGPGTYGAEPRHRAAMLGRETPPKDVTKRSLNFGDYVSGDLYLPTKAAEEIDAAVKAGKAPPKLPGIVWLGPLNPPAGYGAGYRRGDQPYVTLARAGYAVLAFDAVGSGYRVREATRFYARFPRWSLMGKMVADAGDAVRALRETPGVDPANVWLVGFGLGGSVALHAAALDEVGSIAGVATVCGWTPMRVDGPDATGAFDHLTRWTAIHPRLSSWAEQRSALPYDYAELLALAAPRPLIVIAPQLDREASVADVRAAVAAVRTRYDQLKLGGRLRLETPEDYARFSTERQRQVLELLAEFAGK